MDKCPKPLCVREQTRLSIDRHRDAATCLKWAGLSHGAHLSHWAHTWGAAEGKHSVCTQCSCVGKLTHHNCCKILSTELFQLWKLRVDCTDIPTCLHSSFLHHSLYRESYQVWFFRYITLMMYIIPSTGYRMKIQRVPGLFKVSLSFLGS